MSITSNPQGANPVSRTCPECGTINPRRAASCWLCHAPLGGTINYDRDYPRRDAAAANQGPTALVTSVLLTVLALLVFIGMLLSGSAALAAMALFFMAAAAPTLNHLFQAARPTEAAADVLSIWKKVGIVIAAVGETTLVLLGAGVMFFLTCGPLGVMGLAESPGMAENWEIILSAVGIGAGGAVAYVIVRSRFRKPPEGYR